MIVITSLENQTVLERWNFDIETNGSSVEKPDAEHDKSEKVPCLVHNITGNYFIDITGNYFILSFSSCVSLPPASLSLPPLLGHHERDPSYHSTDHC